MLIPVEDSDSEVETYLYVPGDGSKNVDPPHDPEIVFVNYYRIRRYRRCIEYFLGPIGA